MATTGLTVYASGSNYTAFVANTSSPAGLLTRGDLAKQFMWIDGKCVASHYSQASAPYCTGPNGFWSEHIASNMSLPGGVRADQWRAGGAANGWTINMFFTSDGTCLPLAQIGGETPTASWFYHDQTHAAPPASAFVPPAICDTAPFVDQLPFGVGTIFGL